MALSIQGSEIAGAGRQGGVFGGSDRTGVARSLAAYLELGKPRITFLVTGTALAAYVVAAGGRAEASILLLLGAGTLLAAAGTNALNQWWERGRDGRMLRTRDRPVPSGRIPARAALAAGLGTAVLGVALLFAGPGPRVGLLGALTVLTYVLVYTPLKVQTPWSTHVGTLPGALPVLGGWVAGAGVPGPTGWGLFAVVLLWQLPHFFALDWLCRADYARAGFSTLAVADPSGRRTARQLLLFAILLLPASLLPLFHAGLGPLYGGVAVTAGGALLLAGAGFYRERSRPAARRVFLASLAYLPLVLGAAVLDVLA